MCVRVHVQVCIWMCTYPLARPPPMLTGRAGTATGLSVPVYQKEGKQIESVHTPSKETKKQKATNAGKKKSEKKQTSGKIIKKKN